MQIPLRFVNCLIHSLLVPHRQSWIKAACAVLLFIVLLLAWGIVRQAKAEGPVDLYSGTAPAPLGVTYGRLTSQVVDANIEETGGHVFVTVKSSFHIANTDEVNSQAITISLPVALPGGFIFDPEVLSDVVVRVDGEKRELTPLISLSPQAGENITQAYTLVLNQPPKGTSVVELSYRQDLGVGEKATFHFASSVASRWPGPISSSKVTVGFSWPTSQEQMLGIQPAEATFDGQQIVWYENDIEPKDSIKLTFVKPSLWQDILQARLAATENPASAEGHYRLALLYRRLLPTGSLTGTLSSFQSLMLAELEAAKQKAGDEHPSLLCAVHKEWMSFYLENVYRSDGSLDMLYLSQSLQELEQALQVCPESEVGSDAASEVINGYLYLARKARKRGYYESALVHLDSAERVHVLAMPDQNNYERDVSLERRLCYLAWVRDLLQVGDFVAALELAEVGGVADDVLSVQVLAPRFGSVQMVILTDAVQRRIVLSLWPYAPAFATDVSRNTVDTLNGLVRAFPGGRATITLDGEMYLLEVTIPFEHSDDLFREQAAWARVLPDWPELAFVKAVLLSHQGELVVQGSYFTTRAFYSEIVDTREAQKILEGQLQKTEHELSQLESLQIVDSDFDETKEVALTRKQLLTCAQEGWQNLLENTRAVFSIDWEPVAGERVERTWTVGTGQVQEMRLESQVYNLASIAVGVGLILLALSIIVLVLLLFVRLGE